MTALITGASSGIGRDIARELCRRGIRVIISGRNRESLKKLRDELGSDKAKIAVADLSDVNECKRLYNMVKPYNVDILVNNAGFGLFGKFADSDLDTEIEMIDVNVKAVHILAKLFLKDFRGIYPERCIIGRFYAGTLYGNILQHQKLCCTSYRGYPRGAFSGKQQCLCRCIVSRTC